MSAARNTVAVDARWLFTGIGTYTLNLLRHLKELDGGLCIRALTTRANARAVRPFCDEIAIVDAPIYTLREQIGVPWASRHSGLLHVPHYNFPLLRRGPLLVTIADLIHLLDVHHRSTLKSLCYARPMLRMAAARADHIFTVSECSKRQIVEHLRVAPHRITVAYNGVSDHFRPVDRQWARRVVSTALGIRLPYILFVGNLKPHKNVGGLLRAFALLHARTRLDHMLLIIGGGRRAKEACERDAAALGIGDRIVFRSGVPEHLLVSAYGVADLVVQPSFQEGFGLPVLEAMACGAPVACARAASLPEVAGAAAVYFDPHSFEDMAFAMQRVLQDSELEKDLRARGLSRATQFTWQESARAHYRVYRSFLN
jgi:glycosyltransferase involved in cell wall biosynthesis